MFNLMSAVMGIIVPIIWLGVVIYIISLAIRLVKGVERIADILKRKTVFKANLPIHDPSVFGLIPYCVYLFRISGE